MSEAIDPTGSGPDAFRISVRTWLEQNCPPSMRTPAQEDEVVWGGSKGKPRSAEASLWLNLMAERGWTAPTWPREYGGGGLTAEQAAVLTEEMRALQCRPPLYGHGVAMLGPVLLDWGTERQKREHLPRIASGAVRWCQGYSEPEAGSDLAAVRMRAQQDGDDFIVNGHKIWTSYATESDWIFCLVRTDPAASKHAGIGFLLVDMASPGIRAVPIRLISGGAQFCEVFFENVRVPAHNLVGGEHDGWAIAKSLLEHERKMLSSLGGRQRQRVGRPLKELAVEASRRIAEGALDPALRGRIAQYDVDDHAYQFTLRRLAAEAGPEGPGPVSSMVKLYAAELNQRRLDLAMECSGMAGLGWEEPGFDQDELQLTRGWLRSRANTIEGGTSEIMLNVIAKRVLGLPD